MPMLASAWSGRPGTPGGFAGFSTKSVMFHNASTAITPKAFASSSGTSMHATVHWRALDTWSASISA